MNEIELFLLDMDGTVYVEDKLIKGAKEKIAQMRTYGKKICFLTNNSSRSPLDYIQKLAKLGITITPNEIYTSGDSAVRFLNKFHKEERVFLLGTSKLRQQFAEVGINLVDERPDIVMVGYDTELRYDNLCKAVTFISQGAKYFVTHADINCPASPVYVPDVGSFIALIERSCGKIPTANCGKPYELMGDAIAEKFNLSPNKIAMVGDRLSTDIQFAINNGFTSILVLSGETTMDDYMQSGMKVDYVLPSINEITFK